MDISPRAVRAHYARGDLIPAFAAALRAAGHDPAALDPGDLDPVDQFHPGGKAATLALARLVGLRGGAAVLDVGGGLGGPARTLANEIGCRVTVVDLTAAYCRVGAWLTARTGLAGRVQFVAGDALALPIADARAGVVWMQCAAMNVADKERLYAECRRALRPGGRLALLELATGRRVPLRFPVPWARNQALSYLRPPGFLRDLLSATGFAELAWEDVSAATLAWYLAGGAAPGAGRDAASPLGLDLLLGPDARTMAANLWCNLAEGRIALVQGVFARR